MFPLSALLFFIGNVAVQAATYYVASSGNDSYSCAMATAIASPLRTIKHGMDCMRAGDRLYIRGGTYNEQINSNNQIITSGTSWSDAPIISGYPGETVIISGGGSGVILIALNVQYVSFENIIVDGQNTADNVVGLGTSGGTGAHHIRFKNCEIKNAGHILVFLHGSNNIIDGCHIHHSGNTIAFPRPTNRHYGLYVEGSYNLVQNSEIDHTNDHGITSYSGYNMPAGNVYRNNRFHHTGLLSASSPALGLDKGSALQAYNNVIYSTTGHGLMIGSNGATGPVAYNNTIYGGAQSGIWIQSSSSGAIVRNNIVYANASGQIGNDKSDTVLSNNLTTNPYFVDAASNNFDLQTNSPAVDAGEAVGIVTTDIRMKPRPQGASYDIGAYEVGAGSGAAPSPPKNLTVR